MIYKKLLKTSPRIIRLSALNKFREKLYLVEGIGFVKHFTFESRRLLPLGCKVILKQKNDLNSNVKIIKLKITKMMFSPPPVLSTRPREYIKKYTGITWKENLNLEKIPIDKNKLCDSITKLKKMNLITGA